MNKLVFGSPGLDHVALFHHVLHPVLNSAVLRGGAQKVQYRRLHLDAKAT